MANELQFEFVNNDRSMVMQEVLFTIYSKDVILKFQNNNKYLFPYFIVNFSEYKEKSMALPAIEENESILICSLDLRFGFSVEVGCGPHPLLWFTVGQL